MQVEFVDHAQCGQVPGQGVAPVGQTASFVDQFKRADAGMVVVVERQTGAQWPCLPFAIAGGAGEQTAIGDNDQAGGKLQTVIEIDFQPRLGLFAGGQLRLDFGNPAAWEPRLGAGGVLWFFGHQASIP